MEERVVDELKAEIETLPPGVPAPLPRVVRPSSRLALLGAATVAGVVAVTILGGQLPPGSDMSIQIGAHSVPVNATPIMSIGESPVFQGSTGPAPEFQPPGEEIPLRQRDHPRTPSHSQVVNPDPVVYIGEVEAGSALMYSTSQFTVAPHEEPAEESWIARLLTSLSGDEEDPDGLCRQIVGPQGLGVAQCDIGDEASGLFAPNPDEVAVGAQAGMEIRPVSAAPYLWWVGLPPETAVVTVATPVGAFWQRPKAGTIVLPLDRLLGPLSLTALDVRGNTLSEETFEPAP
ncbi:hypothetical protein BH23ACT4_BH23ACT4_16530 [soil metagenome]